MTKRYAHWVGQPAPAEAGVPMVSYEGASLENAAGRWLIADHQGSIIAAAHPSGATAWVNTYDEYGIPGAANAGRFQYTGQIWLPELGMYHYKARVYSPTLGRFLQTDPVGYQDQFNLYAYVGNDPVNQTDPTGEQSCRHPPCPDIPPPPTRETREARELVGHAQRRGGNERGVNSYRNTRTGQTRLESGRAAGRPITAANGRREFQHRLTWHRGTERPSLITHVHNGSERESRDLRRSSETRANNAPSDIDQIAMHQQGIPVQVVGPDASMTLYRTDSQDRIRVESGDRSQIPDLTSQHIIIDPER